MAFANPNFRNFARLTRQGPVEGGLARRENALMGTSTALMMVGFLIASLISAGARDVNLAFSAPAQIVGVALAVGMIVESRAGLANLVRVDLLMLAAFYLLTFLEFIFPQSSLEGSLSLVAARTSVNAVLIGFSGIVLGRHAFPLKRRITSLTNINISSKQIFNLLVGCFFFGYLYMLLSVNFNIFEAIHLMSQPRFTQPWTRGRFGSWSTLLNEVGLLVYLLPALGGAILARGRQYSILQKVVTYAILLFVFYEAFASGTRNILLIHLATFGAGYALLLPKLSWTKLAMIAVPTAAIASFAIYFMTDIRTVGLAHFQVEAPKNKPLFVDMNLVNIANLTQVFPQQAGYLGLEIPYTAAIRPIPRAIWPSKPEGLSFSIEEALGVGSNMTLTATFVGEFWMAGGFLAVAIGSLALGAAAGAWNRVGAAAPSTLRLTLYVSGIFPATLCMRGFMAVAPPMLPVLALYILIRTREKQTRGRPATVRARPAVSSPEVGR